MAANLKSIEEYSLDEIIAEEVDFNTSSKAFKRLLRRQLNGWVLLFAEIA